MLNCVVILVAVHYSVDNKICHHSVSVGEGLFLSVVPVFGICVVSQRLHYDYELIQRNLHK